MNCHHHHHHHHHHQRLAVAQTYLYLPDHDAFIVKTSTSPPLSRHRFHQHDSSFPSPISAVDRTVNPIPSPSPFPSRAPQTFPNPQTQHLHPPSRRVTTTKTQECLALFSLERGRRQFFFIRSSDNARTEPLKRRKEADIGSSA